MLCKPADLKPVAEQMIYIAEKGIRNGGLRDEIFVQMCKQLTQTPTSEQTEVGWKFFQVLTATFPPSKNLENYLKSFIAERFQKFPKDSQLYIISKYALTSLGKTCKTGPRGRSYTPLELDQALVQFFLTVASSFHQHCLWRHT